MKNKNFYYHKKNPKYSEMELKEGYPVWKNSQEYVHKTQAEKHIRKLEENEVVHHVDGDKLNFDKDNLIILSKNDHWKVSKRLNKEGNLNKANLLIFFLVLALLLIKYPNNEDWGIFSIGILIIIGLLISAYQNFFDWIMRKTKLYKVI
ncbi:MAG: HNH endonuclease [Candidatus Woesearchaeota archaeon]